MSDRLFVTEREEYVLCKLRERCKKINGGSIIDRRYIRSIVVLCSSWNFPVIFENDNQVEIANICRSLLKKGLVEQYEDNGLPSFVPISNTTIVEYSYRKFNQSDVDCYKS